MYNIDNHFERYGKMPPVEDSSFELATTEEELAIQQNRKQSHKLKLKIAIEDMLLYPEGHPKRKKLAQKQQQYKHILSEIESIENAREEIKGK